MSVGKVTEYSRWYKSRFKPHRAWVRLRCILEKTRGLVADKTVVMSGKIRGRVVESGGYLVQCFRGLKGCFAGVKLESAVADKRGSFQQFHKI